MSDGGGGFKQAVQDTGEILQEDIAQPVADEVGKALEAGVTSVIGTPQPHQLTPEEKAKKEEEENKKRQWAQHVVNWNQQLVQDQEKVRNQQKEEEQKKNQQLAEEQKIKQYEVMQEEERRDQLTQQVKEEQTKTEAKAGRGVGG